MRLQPTESETQKAVMEALAAHRIFAFRLNTAAVKVDKRFFRAHSLGKGAADIVALPRSLRVPAPDADGFPARAATGMMRWIDGAPAVWWIEVKRPGGKQSAEQKSFQVAVESEGQNYLLVESVDQILEWIKSLKF